MFYISHICLITFTAQPPVPENRLDRPKIDVLYLFLSGGKKMVLPSLLLKERVVKLSQLRVNPDKTLTGFIRVVSDNGGLKTKGFLLDKEAFIDLLESMEYSGPEFWEEIEQSRKSGRVSSKEVKQRLGMK